MAGMMTRLACQVALCPVFEALLSYKSQQLTCFWVGHSAGHARTLQLVRHVILALAHQAAQQRQGSSADSAILSG